MDGRGLTLDSLRRNGRWGQRANEYRLASNGITPDQALATLQERITKALAALNNEAVDKLKEVDKDLKEIEDIESECRKIDCKTKPASDYDTTSIYPLYRNYLTVLAAASDFKTAKANSATLDLPVLGSTDFEGDRFRLSARSRSSCCCVFISLLISLIMLSLAGVSHSQGSEKFGAENVLHYLTDPFWGVPHENVLRNIWCGLMLGIVFGFLDNFGLFYGTSALDGSFYAVGSGIAIGLVCPKESCHVTLQTALDAHEMTSDMMSGLGNTFSGALARALCPTLPLLDARACVRRSPRRGHRHRRARDGQGRLGRRPVVLAGRHACHRAGLPPRRLCAGGREAQGQAWLLLQGPRELRESQPRVPARGSGLRRHPGPDREERRAVDAVGLDGLHRHRSGLHDLRDDLPVPARAGEP